jgi:hypothetical protein
MTYKNAITKTSDKIVDQEGDLKEKSQLSSMCCTELNDDIKTNFKNPRFNWSNVRTVGDCRGWYYANIA